MVRHDKAVPFGSGPEPPFRDFEAEQIQVCWRATVVHEGQVPSGNSEQTKPPMEVQHPPQATNDEDREDILWVYSYEEVNISCRWMHKASVQSQTAKSNSLRSAHRGFVEATTRTQEVPQTYR